MVQPAARRVELYSMYRTMMRLEHRVRLLLEGQPSGGALVPLRDHRRLVVAAPVHH